MGKDVGGMLVGVAVGVVLGTYVGSYEGCRVGDSVGARSLLIIAPNVADVVKFWKVEIVNTFALIITCSLFGSPDKIVLVIATSQGFL